MIFERENPQDQASLQKTGYLKKLTYYWQKNGHQQQFFKTDKILVKMPLFPQVIFQFSKKLNYYWTIITDFLQATMCLQKKTGK